MKRIIRTGLIAILALLAFSCSRFQEDAPVRRHYLPDGTPVVLNIPFGSSEMVELNVGTRAESSAADESRIHDLYVMIFDNSTLEGGSPKKIYGRYFSYEHLATDLASLDSNPNEGWWVENKTLPGITPAVTTTAGAVKISTTVCSNALLVVLGNVTNAVSSMSDDPDLDDIAYLNGISTLDELRGTKITLEQDVVNRKDLFLMMGTMGKIGPEDSEHSSLNTHDMIWGETPKEYNSTYKLLLQPLDAKVKFMVRCNRDNIDAEKAVYWTVCSTPDKCYLFSDYNAGAAPDDAVFFDSESAYFESTEAADESGYSDWYVFTFYTLENRQTRKKHATAYHDREKQIKTDTGNGGYEWWTKDGGGDREYHSGNYVTNGKWEYANDLATFVKFDMVLTLNAAGIYAATGETVNNALTTDTIFTVHLGDFGSSGNQNVNAFDDYNTLRSHFYTYKITIDNSGSVYAEVENDNERQPGQEGYLLLTNDEIVNADAHYEYHSVSFGYSADWDPSIFSWYVKTPFGQGEPKKTTETVGGRTYPLYSGDGLDYKWVMFGVNEPDDPDTPTVYSHNRLKYPGIGEYHSDWKPSLGTPAPKLMDINQLIEYLFDQKVRKENDEPNDFLQDTIRVTVFIDEYYYDKNPLGDSDEADPDLWRRFVNAEPREMHILSDARKSRDKKSDVIVSSHSIIQQSIQTIYNTYAPGLRSLWGCEHKDEIKEKVPEGWPYWPADCPLGASAKSGKDDNVGRENGRLNTAYIWGTYSSQGTSGSDNNERVWADYMNFNVDNDTPELQTGFQGMAFSCLTRNRDNDGNGKIDRDEVRWYMASTRQLVGMWIGNESLSLSARLYQPAEGQWRAHVVSSTNQLTCWAEEGAGATPLDKDWAGGDYHTWASPVLAAAGESVRCLRNIGTYDGASGVTDISYAPYKQEIDKYFEIETEGSGVNETTTFYFDRLNTKSIREYSEGELPYHAQTSPNNRVYVKMTTQPLSSQVDEFSILSKDINPEISAAGQNTYCPAGWRLPNQSEFILMSLYMNESYFKQDAEGNNYAGTVYLPSRTYYDRGLYGDLRQTSGPWSSEKDKVGWAYSTSTKKTFCTGSTATHTITRTRCVRDDKMTGVISGDLLLNDTTIYPEDWTPIIFNFSSVASAFTYASLKLCYNTHNGNYREWDVPIDRMPSGLQYRDTLKAIIPSLATLGLDAADFPIPMTLQAQVRNLAGQTETKNVNLTMNVATGGKVTVDFPSKSNQANGMPVRVKMSIGGHSIKFTGATLEWKESGSAWNSYPITGLDTDFDRSYTEEIYLKSLFDAAGNTDFSTGDFIGKRYSYRLVVTSSDGHTEYSPTKSLEVIKYYYTPNVQGVEINSVFHRWDDPWWQTFENANGWYNSLPSTGTYANFRQKGIINTTWPAQQITNLDFDGGDFIEADIDVSNCVFIRTVHGKLSDTSPKNNTVGMDNILGIGPTGAGWIAGALQIYYPAHTPVDENSAATPSDKIQFDALHTTSDYSKIQAGELPGYVNIVLDSSGVKWNGTQQTNLGNANQSTVVPNLVTRNSLYIGAEEGNHYSRATYNYVRVIRNREM